jgi:hypothetical protein
MYILLPTKYFIMTPSAMHSPHALRYAMPKTNATCRSSFPVMTEVVELASALSFERHQSGPVPAHRKEMPLPFLLSCYRGANAITQRYLPVQSNSVG